LIAELEDYREPKIKDKKSNDEAKSNTADTMRVVLRPNPETLWADIRLLNQKDDSKWTDQQALEVEAKILVCFCLRMLFTLKS
jgi:transcription factor SPT20